ncbi:hypothetical protein H696_00461 [Fonticula alba]|uniref:separase n=1 Tax=Fonticula alba TaxID=691883 RepID=A0A058ZEQ5_FONAL|nr:hypothetical protein H696_00461 [Fonticula alba]KCV72890.1 hypothetical protein H696_00461 [Fonticula alba]|eukprot:XP_009492591.1 hypothetical protein H696_00461 [Fonticula alba]
MAIGECLLRGSPGCASLEGCLPAGLQGRPVDGPSSPQEELLRLAAAPLDESRLLEATSTALVALAPGRATSLTRGDLDLLVDAVRRLHRMACEALPGPSTDARSSRQQGRLLLHLSRLELLQATIYLAQGEHGMAMAMAQRASTGISRLAALCGVQARTLEPQLPAPATASGAPDPALAQMRLTFRLVTEASILVQRLLCLLYLRAQMYSEAQCHARLFLHLAQQLRCAGHIADAETLCAELAKRPWIPLAEADSPEAEGTVAADSPSVLFVAPSVATFRPQPSDSATTPEAWPVLDATSGPRAFGQMLDRPDTRTAGWFAAPVEISRESPSVRPSTAPTGGRASLFLRAGPIKGARTLGRPRSAPAPPPGPMSATPMPTGRSGLGVFRAAPPPGSDNGRPSSGPFALPGAASRPGSAPGSLKRPASGGFWPDAGKVPRVEAPPSQPSDHLPELFRHAGIACFTAALRQTEAQVARRCLDPGEAGPTASLDDLLACRLLGTSVATHRRLQFLRPPSATGETPVPDPPFPGLPRCPAGPALARLATELPPLWTFAQLARAPGIGACESGDGRIDDGALSLTLVLGELPQGGSGTCACAPSNAPIMESGLFVPLPGPVATVAAERTSTAPRTCAPQTSRLLSVQLGGRPTRAFASIARRFTDIMLDNTRSLERAGTMAAGGSGADSSGAREWWTERLQLDRDLEAVCGDLEAEVLGIWHVLLLPPPVLATPGERGLQNTEPAAIVAEVQHRLQLVLGRFIRDLCRLEEHGDSATCMARLLPDHIARQLLLVGPRPSASLLRQLLEDLVHSPAVAGDWAWRSPAAREAARMAVTAPLVAALAHSWRLAFLLATPVTRAAGDADTLSSEEAALFVPCPGQPHHLALCLEPKMSHLPWESMPCLRERSVTRLLSGAFLSQHVALMTAPGAGWSGRLEGALAAPPARLPVDDPFFLLNPSGDLADTERRLGRLMVSPWHGKAGPVTRAEVAQHLGRRGAQRMPDIVLYCGHGTGRRYLPAHMPSVMLLMGCSSVADPHAVISQLLGGSPTVVGNLWAVSDRDADLLTARMLQLLGLPLLEEDPAGIGPEAGGDASHTSGGETIPLAVARARRRCRLRFLNGAAAVVYGLPVSLVMGASNGQPPVAST